MGEYFSGRGIVVVAKTFQVLVQCEVAAAGRTGCKSAKEAEVKVSHAEAFILWEVGVFEAHVQWSDFHLRKVITGL